MTETEQQEFSRYYANFTRPVTILDYNNARKHALKRGLSAEMIDGLRFQNFSAKETLADYEDRLKCLDDSIRRSKGLGKPSPAPQNRQNTGQTASQAAGRTAKKQLLPDEHERRMAQGLCLYSRGAGNMAREHQTTPPPAPPAIAASTQRQLPSRPPPPKRPSMLSRREKISPKAARWPCFRRRKSFAS